MLDNLKFYLRSAIYVAAGAAFLYYISGLTLRASVVLAACFGFVFLWIEALVEAGAFRPYNLSIRVPLPVILTDMGLISNVDDYTPIRNKVGRDLEHHTFYAITASVFARSDRGTYSTTLYIYENIDALEVPWERGMFEENPVVFLHKMGNVYQFGTRLQREWWDKERKLDLVHPWLRALEADQAGNIILCTVPLAYFRHIARWYEPVRIFESWNRKQRKMHKTLAALGWTVDDDYPNHIEHRYLAISYHEL